MAGSDPKLESVPAGHPDAAAVAALPTFSTTFVGREVELAQVGDLVAASRLVTITGFGGVGKTRLIVQLASQIALGYPNGVWLVRLSPVQNPDHAPLAAADELGIPGRGDPFGVASQRRSTTDDLVRYLEEKHALLIFDHCEHIVESVGSLASALLGRCPSITLLATSQQPLGVPGEQVWALPPMALPDEHADPESSIRSDALELFRERAVAVDPKFRYDRATIPAAVRICRRLDGSPLAIELAAARLNVLDVHQIAERLDDRFRLLRTEGSARPDHHQTLEATVTWSYELLEPLERTAFERLSVFPGSFTAEAAEAIISGGELEPHRVIDVLSALLAKSALMRLAPTEGHLRYRLPQILRGYAEQRLAERGDSEALRRQHAAHFLDFAARRANDLNGPRQVETLDAFHVEHHNLHSAVERAIDSADASTALSLISLLTWMWSIRNVPEGAELAERALRLSSPVAPELRSRAQIGVGLLLAATGQPERAVGHLLEARAERAAAGDGLAVAQANLFLGLAAYMSGDLDTAEDRFSDCSPAFEDRPSAALGAAWVDFFRGWIARDRRRWEDAARFFDSSLETFRAIGEPFGMANALAESGTLARRRGNVEGAQRAHRESLGLFRDLGDRVRTAQVLGSLGLDEREQGDINAALDHFSEAIAVATDIGAKAAEAEGRYLQGETLRRAGRDEEARAALRAAFAAAAETEEHAALLTRALALESLAELATRSGQHGRAVQLASAAEALRDRIDRPAVGAHRQRISAALVDARSHLSDDAYRRLYAGGRDLEDDRLAAAVLSDEDPAVGTARTISLEQVELGERVARQLSSVADRRELRLGGIRVTGRRRRPTGESPPLPIELRTSGWVWLGFGALVLAIWASLFAWPETTQWWEFRDQAVADWFVSLRSDAATAMARAVHALGSAWLWRPLRWAVLIVLAFVARRWRHFFGVLIATAVVGWIVEFFAVQVARPRPFVPILGAWQGYSHPSVPVAELGLTLALIGFTLIPRGRWRFRYLIAAGAAVLTLVVARVYLGVDHLTDGVVSACFAPAAVVVIFRLWAPESVFPVAYRRGRTAHLDVGGARGRAIVRAIGDQLGIPIAGIERIGLEASGGSTPLRLRVAGDPPTHLFGKLYARNHLRADRWYKVGRTILYGALEDEVSFRTVRRLVEYEDYLLLTMSKAGIPSTRPFGLVEITPDQEYLIVAEFLEGAVEIDKADVDHAMIDDALLIVRRMWDEGLAHRDIKPGNVMVHDGEVRLIDVAFGLVRPTPWRQAVDLANMMLVLSLRADPQTVYERALQFFAPEDIAEAFAATRGITVPRQLAAELKAGQRQDGVDRMERFRELAPPAEPVSIQRWSRRRIGLALGALAAGLLLLGMLIENVQGRGIL